MLSTHTFAAGSGSRGAPTAHLHSPSIEWLMDPWKCVMSIGCRKSGKYNKIQGYTDASNCFHLMASDLCSAYE